MKHLWRNKKRIATTLPIAAILVLMPLLSACMKSDASSATGTPEPASGDSAEFTLKTGADNEGLFFVGVGGEIEGVRNPPLDVAEGGAVTVTLVNGDGAEHNVSFPDFGTTSTNVITKDSETSVTFTANKTGAFEYFCALPGHKQAGMLGELTVGEPSATAGATADDIARLPNDVPAPVGARDAQDVRFDINIVEKEGQLNEGATYTYWTFDGTVPGPMLRVREGDSVELHLANPADSTTTHSIDLHAVNGPGGGATVTQVAPGEEKMFTFTALNPGIYVYHCATPSVAHHIAQGMYGMILVEPEGGLPPVDHEYYVAQGEMYTVSTFAATGHQEPYEHAMSSEHASYVVFNGAAGSLTTAHPLTANVGETVRIFFGDGGPNYTSSFHVIGEIFDRVYSEGSITSPPLTNVQTTTVAPGGATMVEFTVDVPGRYLLVDHALSRIEKGALGFLVVEGEPNPDVFDAPEGSSSDTGH